MNRYKRVGSTRRKKSTRFTHGDLELINRALDHFWGICDQIDAESNGSSAADVHRIQEKIRRRLP